MAEYAERTDNIEIKVEPFYVPEQSSPESDYYFFAYKVTIVNHGQSPMQLTHRHWIIVDGKRRVQEVRGEGVVGVQPTIKPGDSFEYSSFCPLPTPTGNMRGSYDMLNENGEKISVNIPVFFLRDLKHDQ